MAKVNIQAKLAQMKAHAQLIIQLSEELEKEFGVVSTPPTTRKGKYAKSLAKVMARREALINK